MTGIVVNGKELSEEELESKFGKEVSTEYDLALQAYRDTAGRRRAAESGALGPSMQASVRAGGSARHAKHQGTILTETHRVRIT